MTTGAAFHRDPAGHPSAPGAYLLWLELSQLLTVHLAGSPGSVLPSGNYLYCGSARGPGGIKARVRRHMRRDKTVRWHVDQLTTAGTVIGAWVFPGGDECALVAMMADLPVPISGFGSSDCKSCPSHLLSWPLGLMLPFDIRPRLAEGKTLIQPAMSRFCSSRINKIGRNNYESALDHL